DAVPTITMPSSPKGTVIVQSVSRPQSPEKVQIFASHVEPVDIPEAGHTAESEDSAAATAAAAASWIRASGQDATRSLSP
ncbi:unnamed protein product, partial [Symbiodinium pilosum]